LLAVAYYIIFPSRGYFHSDCTDTILWAQAAYEARSLFNPGFTYAALFPFGGPLLMLPWVGLFGVSMTAHTLGMLAFLILFAAALFFLLRSLGWDSRWTAAALALLLPALSLSDKSREIFWGHILYYNLGCFSCSPGWGCSCRPGACAVPPAPPGAGPTGSGRRSCSSCSCWVRPTASSSSCFLPCRASPRFSSRLSLIFRSHSAIRGMRRGIF
jgi:hypothetical protein